VYQDTKKLFCYAHVKYTRLDMSLLSGGCTMNRWADVSMQHRRHITIPTGKVRIPRARISDHLDHSIRRRDRARPDINAAYFKTRLRSTYTLEHRVRFHVKRSNNGCLDLKFPSPYIVKTQLENETRYSYCA